LAWLIRLRYVELKSLVFIAASVIESKSAMLLLDATEYEDDWLAREEFGLETGEASGDVVVVCIGEVLAGKEE
jgi:hypothetical protein